MKNTKDTDKSLVFYLVWLEVFPEGMRIHYSGLLVREVIFLLSSSFLSSSVAFASRSDLRTWFGGKD